MRNALIFAFVLLPLSAVASPALRACFERREDNGSLNIYPVDVVVNGHKAATLLGGKHACVAAKGAAPKVWLRWHAVNWQRPDHGLHGARVESSKPLPLLPELKMMHLQVCSIRPRNKPPRWHIAGDGGGACR